MKKAMRVALYVRVSTKVQSTAMQIEELTALAERFEWNVVEIFDDTGESGGKSAEDRPQLKRLLGEAKNGRFDLVAVWSVDRLGRSVLDLVSILQELHLRGVELLALKQSLDTRSPSGKMMWQLLSVFAEFERETIRERVRSGLESAKARGVKLGRRTNVTSETPQQVMALRQQGLNVVKVARQLKIAVGTVSKICKQQEAEAA